MLRTSFILFYCMLTYLQKQSYGQVPFTGKCIEKKPITPIDIRKLSGQWYEIEASPLLAEWPYKCISIKVSLFFEKKSEVKIDGISRFTQKPESRTIHASIPDYSDGKDGIIKISVAPSAGMPSMAFRFDNITIQILAVDYHNWALVTMCKEHEKANAHTEILWIISRQRALDVAQYKAVRETILSLQLESISTRETIQNGCTAEIPKKRKKPSTLDEEQVDTDNNSPEDT